MKSPVAVVQEYDRKKKLAGDLGNGFVRFNLSPAKVRKSPLCEAFNIFVMNITLPPSRLEASSVCYNG